MIVLKFITAGNMYPCIIALQYQIGLINLMPPLWRGKMSAVKGLLKLRVLL